MKRTKSLQMKFLSIAASTLVLAACGGGGGGGGSNSNSATTFSIGGNIEGKATDSVVLTNHGANQRRDQVTAVVNDRTYTFSNKVNKDTVYRVTADYSQNGHLCNVQNASGTATTTVNDINVACREWATSSVQLSTSNTPSNLQLLSAGSSSGTYVLHSVNNVTQQITKFDGTQWSSSSPLNKVIFPSNLALKPDGNLWFISRLRNNFNQDIGWHLNEYNTSNGTFSSESQIINNSNILTRQNFDLVHDNQGNIAIAHVQKVPGATYPYRTSPKLKVKKKGHAFRASIDLVTSTSVANSDVQDNVQAYINNGTLSVVFYDKVSKTLSAYRNSIASFYSFNTGQKKDLVTISDTATASVNFRIVMNKDNDLTVIYNQQDGDNTDKNKQIKAVTWLANDTVQSPVDLQNTTGVGKTVSLSDALIDSSGNIIVVWKQQVGTGTINRVFSNHYDASSDSWLSTTDLLDASNAVESGVPKMAMDSNDNVIVAWFNAPSSSTDKRYIAYHYNPNTSASSRWKKARAEQNSIELYKPTGTSASPIVAQRQFSLATLPNGDASIVYNAISGTSSTGQLYAGQLRKPPAPASNQQ